MYAQRAPCLLGASTNRLKIDKPLPVTIDEKMSLLVIKPFFTSLCSAQSDMESI